MKQNLNDIIIVNFKAYAATSDEHATKIAKICAEVEKEKKTVIFAAVSSLDLKTAKKVHSNILAQHIDPAPQGAHTGFIPAISAHTAGAVGTLLNHSEHQLPMDVLEKSIEEAKKAGLITIVCANTSDVAKEVAKFSPDFIAIEPSELIGGNISVSTAQPEIITETIKKVHSVKNIPVLCGAGIKNANDVRIAKKLGAAGILVASGVVLAKDIKAALEDLANGFL